MPYQPKQNDTKRIEGRECNSELQQSVTQGYRKGFRYGKGKLGKGN